MSFPRYPKYKESGVEWLGKVPEHWGTGSVRWLTRRYAGGTPDKTNVSFWENGTIPWINSGAVNDRLIREPSAYITESAFQNSSTRWVPVGALVLALAGQGKTKGTVAQVAIRTTCNQSMAAIVPGPELQVRFLYWWLRSNYENIRNLSGGDLRDGLNLELVGNIRCPLPTRQEQTAIAAFLDRETAKIDALIAEQQRLIELLKEKRQAVISHAVTKGLNPNVDMKPSGIDWLGDVPEHWKVAPLKRLVSIPIIDGPHETPIKYDSGVPFVSAEATSGGQIDFDKKWGFISAEVDARYSKRYKPKRGDILMVKLGATAGVTAMVETDLDFNVWVPLAAIRLQPEINAYFLLNVLRSEAMSRAFRLNWTFGTQQTLGLRTISNLAIPLPPANESREIVAHLNAAVPPLETLIAEGNEVISLLQERRTALISAAVTGQIDVRSLT